MFKMQILSIRSVLISALTTALCSIVFVAEARMVATTDLSNVVERVAPSVVSIFIKPKKKLLEKEILDFYGFGNLPEDNPMRNYFQKFFSDEESDSSEKMESLPSGSGFFITDDGYIMTSNHVIDSGVSVSVILSDDTELPAQVIGTDKFSDLAILKVKSDRKFVPVEFEDISNIRLGETVFTIGNPLGLRGSVNAGIVSALDRNLHDRPGKYIQIDAPINKGNSGGPCFNALGHVIGVNNLIFTIGQSAANMGIGFIIPGYTAKKAIPSLISKGMIDHGWFGVVVQNLTQDLANPLGFKGKKGLLVSSVVKGSPADNAGIKEGDIIYSINGKNVKNVQDFAWDIGSHSPKEKVDISIYKGGNEHSITVVLGSSPVVKNDVRSENRLFSSDTKELLGMRLQNFVSENKKFVRIVDLDSNIEANHKGIRKGMDIISVNTNKVYSIKDVERFVEQAKKNKRNSVLLQLSYGSDLQSNDKLDNNKWFVSLKIR
ncbi:trypsin-like peptidase domain-containing protein [Candidatus Liberibacter brunswickensis]|uniref:trypsin-like peptidase domain-containing protein n=1 Tax=Candidatus Liberibacter brunswickensis TaxID=1968796 RepID=UPI002FDF4341